MSNPDLQFTKFICRSLRELDALVAEKVMGWHRQKMGLDDYLCPFPNFSLSTCNWEPIDHQHLAIADFLPHYSTNIAAAWKVLEPCKRYRCGIAKHDYHRGGLYLCEISEGGGNWYRGSADSAPQAICLALLKLHGLEVELAL